MEFEENKRTCRISATVDAEKWKKLPSSKKAEHSLMEFYGCSCRYSYEQSLFPVKSKQFKKKAKAISLQQQQLPVRSVSQT